jgi:ribosome-binding protein aMBF1 (putative translation factor)
MTSVRERFAANVRQAREKAGISQEALADECDLHRTEISCSSAASARRALRRS